MADNNNNSTAKAIAVIVLVIIGAALVHRDSSKPAESQPQPSSTRQVPRLFAPATENERTPSDTSAPDPSPTATGRLYDDSCKRVREFNDQNSSNGRLQVPDRAMNANTCVLGMDNAGEAVTALQRALNACYGAGLEVDGLFGSATQQALVDAQASEGITADGVYGPQTRAHLRFAQVSAGGGTRCGSRL